MGFTLSLLLNFICSPWLLNNARLRLCCQHCLDSIFFFFYILFLLYCICCTALWCNSVAFKRAIEINFDLTWLDLNACSCVLDSVAPLKVLKPKRRSEPWLNSNVRVLRQECRKAERKWKKDKLQVSYEILKNALSAYHHSVKNAKLNIFLN